MVKTMSHAVFRTFGVSLIVETQKFLKTNVQDKRLYTKWGYVPQQYVTSSAQDAEYANVVFHNKMPIPLQALLNLAKPVEHLSFKDIREIMRSKCLSQHTVVGLEGGEFLLHPEADVIMEWFKENHPNYTLLSNCLNPQKVIDAVRKFHPAHLYVSLDGDKETYKSMRGCNGHDKVIEVVKAVRDEVPISLMFCLSPWNSFSDMRYVIEVAKEYDIDVRIGIYGTMDFFDTTAELLSVDFENYIQNIPQNIHDTKENFDFVALYEEWRNGNIRLRCQSIFSELVIHSNGDVPLCQNLDVKLGNIHTHSLDDIFNSRFAHKEQCRYSKECNACWINFHRKYDLILLRNLERFLPKSLFKSFMENINGQTTLMKHIGNT